MLTERDVAAYTLVMLLDRHILPRSRADEAMRLLDLTPVQVQAALDLYERRGHRPPTCDPAAQPFNANDRRPMGANPGALRKQRGNMRESEHGTERRCARCEEWFPADAEHFGWKDRHRGFLRSYCVGCWVARQRETYLSEARRQVLEGAGLTFTVPDGADVAGVRCAKCDQPIIVGQDVSGHTELVHVACGDS